MRRLSLLAKSALASPCCDWAVPILPGARDPRLITLRRGGTLTDERKAQMSADIPLGRVGTVEDVAALLTFLMSEDAGYITAATYDVNGGLQIS